MKYFGRAFGDEVYREKRTARHSRTVPVTGWGARVTALQLVLLITLFILLVRLIHVTVFEGNYYRELSDTNRTKQVIIHAPRGVIFDRQGVPLTRNVPAYRLNEPCRDKEGLCPRVITQDDVLKMIAASTFDPTTVETDVVREYLYGPTFAHAVGYLSEITSEELNDPYYSYQEYRLGDRIGRDGIEAAFETQLRGSDGKEFIERDATGSAVRVLGRTDAVPGTNVTSSLDLQLQQVGFAALGDIRGAVVVSVPNTGELLALVSTPSYDVNQFQKGLTQQAYTRLLTNPDKPLFDRAIGGLYPPGSTFKIITATAALEEHAITGQTIIEDTGIVRVGQYSYSNWYFTQYGKTEESVDILKAFARSNDIFFYKLGEYTGIEALAAWGKKFGIGSPSGIEISGEVLGVMPDPVQKQKSRGEDWFLGDTYHIAIGQGDIQVTPLQVNRWTDVIANGGRLCPSTLEKIRNSKFEIRNCKDLGISKKTIELITEGMRRACYRGTEDGYQGTGWPLFDFDPPVACKTGTAEFGDPDNKTHAWFTAFAPIEDPEISVTVLVEQGGEGSSIAGPIAKKVLEEWFAR